MKKNNLKYLKLAVVLLIAGLLIWALILKPKLSFTKYESEMENAAKRYYDLNSSELPTGNRIATVSMQQLYSKAYLKEDFYIPYTKEPCSMKDSWVKVRKVNGKYKYYTYLKCGALESNVDNKGPEIKLNGSSEITLNLGDKYKEPGIKSVADKTDGKMDIKKVSIDTSDLDTNKVGEYKVTYTAFDSFKNKTEQTRTVKVISKLKNAVLKATDKKGYYVGLNPNNYLSLSGMMFRIVGIDGDNVKIIAQDDVSNVNYDGIDSWLDYYMKHINDEAKSYLVKNKYCDMKLTDDNLATTKCTNKSKSKYASIISIDDINKSADEAGHTYLKTKTMSWTANKNKDNTAYIVRTMIAGPDLAHSNYLESDTTINYGVRPVLTVKGNALLKSGNGTEGNPYTFGETKQGKAAEKINKRYSGEYISYGGLLWRIIEPNEDGTTKIISVSNIKQNGKVVKTAHTTKSEKKIYNPKQSGNVGYFINNRVSEFIDTSYFVNKNVKVPIYEKDILYGKEKETKEYKVKLSAPNTYEMFSTKPSIDEEVKSYWLINSSNTKYYKGTVTDIGVVLNGTISDFEEFGIRVVGNLHKNTMITRGKGTYNNPYIITK